jgi:hypothetical protein
MAAQPPISLQARLQRELGEGVQVVSVREDGAHRLRGVAVCAGRIMSFVLDAEAERLRTQPLFELMRSSRIS